MAFHTARSRDPLLDTKMQAALERRTQEMVGLLLIGIAVALGLALATYSPEDPGWMSTGNGAANNLLGRTGAAVAAPLVLIVGKGAWGLMLVPLVWGSRLLFHIGSEGFGSRIIFAPIAVALGAVYASTLVPGDAWVHSFGLGGLFGDTVLGAMLGVLPISATLGLKILSILLAAALVASMLFVLGFSRLELYRIGSFALRGLLQTGRGLARATVNGIVWFRERRAERAAQRTDYLPESSLHPEPIADARARVFRAEPPLVQKDADAEALIEPELIEEPVEEKPGFLARVRARTLNAQAAAGPVAAEPANEEERVQTMISEAIRRRRDRDSGRSMILPKTPAVRGEEPPLMRAAVEAATEGLVDQDDDFAHPEADEFLDVPDALVEAQEPDAEEAQISSRHVALDRTAPVFQNSPEPGKAMVQHPPRKPAQPSRQAQAEAQPALSFEERHSDYECPALSLLSSPVAIERHHLSDEALEENARMLESVLDDYGVKGEIVSVRPGPVVTMYELEPAPGLKASRVIGLADDIARSMSALAARVSTVPGRSVIGIELPNAVREKVVLREILSTRDFGDGNQRLPLALGKDIGGEPVVANLAKMPHLLIAGTTGSGKSVAINTMILSLLYKLTPDECRLIMIDPKMLELSVYDGIPHLLSPVVTDPKKAVVALKWVVGEMEERYRRMSKMGVRNIEGFNGRVRDTLAKGEMFTRTVQTGFDEETGEPIFETEETKPETLPYIVVIVDEMADLMMVAGKEIEACIQRLAQMARASGIHLIMATQRPSVDVITGTIKANFPTRISFQVTSKVDSRTILGEMGAEQLLGMGDMLYMAGGAKITRVHGPFVSDEEVEEIVSHLKSYGPPDYVSTVLDGPEDGKSDDIDLVLGLGGNTDGEDALYDQAVQIVIQDRKCSTSYIQRKLAIGYNKAARLVEQMEENGLVSSANHVGKREILVPEQQ